MDVWKKVCAILSAGVIGLLLVCVLSISSCIGERRDSAGAIKEAARMADLIGQLGPSIERFAGHYEKLNDLIGEFEDNQQAMGRAFSDLTVIMGERAIVDREVEAGVGELSTGLEEASETARGLADDIDSFIDGATEESSTD